MTEHFWAPVQTSNRTHFTNPEHTLGIDVPSQGLAWKPQFKFPIWINWRHTANFYADIYSFQFLLWLTTEKLWSCPPTLSSSWRPFIVSLSKGTACAHQHRFPLCTGPWAHYSRPSFRSLIYHPTSVIISSFYSITFIYLRVHEWSRHTIHVEVTEQRAGASSGLPPYSSQSLFPTTLHQCSSPQS